MTDSTITPKSLLQAAAEQLQAEFAEIRASNPHAGESGAEAEEILGEFLKERLPRRFDVASGVVIGTAGEVSSQTDLIIYDALNSPVYRKGPRMHIVPRDNVAAVVEVKSKLNKDQLRDAADKIASVKQIQASPISNLDQPVTMGPLIIANTFGCVFAYDSYTSLDTLADNLREFNESRDSSEWIDHVTVLGKGSLSYAIQFPMSKKFSGWYGGATEDRVTPWPIYTHLVKDQSPDLALNQFYLRLVSHLTFFRKRTPIDIEGVLGSGQKQAMTIQGYQHDLNGSLIPVEPTHVEGQFKNPECRYNLYSREERTLLGQVCLWPWQDGAVITCSVCIDPSPLFNHYFRSLQLEGQVLPPQGEYNIWYSSVLPIEEPDFVKATEELPDQLIPVRDSPDDSPPSVKLPDAEA